VAEVKQRYQKRATGDRARTSSLIAGKWLTDHRMLVLQRPDDQRISDVNAERVVVLADESQLATASVVVEICHAGIGRAQVGSNGPVYTLAAWAGDLSTMQAATAPLVGAASRRKPVCPSIRETLNKPVSSR